MKSFQTSFWAWLDKSLTFNVIYLPIVYIEHGLFKKKKKCLASAILVTQKCKQTNKNKKNQKNWLLADLWLTLVDVPWKTWLIHLFITWYDQNVQNKSVGFIQYDTRWATEPINS